MSFLRFNDSVLMDDAPVDGGGGSNPNLPPTPPPVFDPVSFRTELKTELLAEVRKDLNGIDKKFKKEFDGINTQFGSFNTNFSSFKTDLQKMLTPEQHEESHETPPAPPPPQPNNNQPPVPQEPPKHAGPPKQSPEVLRMQRELQELRDSLTQSNDANAKKALELDKKEKATAIKAEINRHQFATARDPQDMFSLLEKLVDKAEDGQYYGPEGVPLEEFVKNEWTQRPNWQPIKNANGSGAPAPNPITGRQTFDTEHIRPGMSKDEKAKAWATIAQYAKT